MNKRALVFGACGNLGKAVVKEFRKRPEWEVLAVDVARVDGAHRNMRLLSGSMQAQAQEVSDMLREWKKDSAFNLDAIICTSGGFASSQVNSDQWLEVADKMLVTSVHPSLVATRIASKFLKAGGLLTLPGAGVVTGGAVSEALGPYGAAKAYVHFLTQSLGGGDGMPQGSKSIAIAPDILDTPANRAANPDSDTSVWTPVDHVSSKLVSWALDPTALTNGGIVYIKTQEGKTTFTTDTGENI